MEFNVVFRISPKPACRVLGVDVGFQVCDPLSESRIRVLSRNVDRVDRLNY